MTTETGVFCDVFVHGVRWNRVRAPPFRMTDFRVFCLLLGNCTPHQSTAGRVSCTDARVHAYAAYHYLAISGITSCVGRRIARLSSEL